MVHDYFEIRDINCKIVVGCFSVIAFFSQERYFDYDSWKRYVLRKGLAILREKNLNPKCFELHEIDKERFVENYWWML